VEVVFGNASTAFVSLAPVAVVDDEVIYDFGGLVEGGF
jgi:hypothetical protein